MSLLKPSFELNDFSIDEVLKVDLDEMTKLISQEIASSLDKELMQYMEEEVMKHDPDTIILLRKGIHNGETVYLVNINSRIHCGAGHMIDPYRCSEACPHWRSYEKTSMGRCKCDWADVHQGRVDSEHLKGRTLSAEGTKRLTKLLQEAARDGRSVEELYVDVLGWAGTLPMGDDVQPGKNW